MTGFSKEGRGKAGKRNRKMTGGGHSNKVVTGLNNEGCGGCWTGRVKKDTCHQEKAGGGCKNSDGSTVKDEVMFAMCHFHIFSPQLMTPFSVTLELFLILLYKWSFDDQSLLQERMAKVVLEKSMITHGQFFTVS